MIRSRRQQGEEAAVESAAAVREDPPVRAASTRTTRGTVETVQALSRMIKELEEQLDRMLSINDALESDLRGERERRSKVERSLKQLEAELVRVEQEAATKDDLLAELSHLSNERARLAATVEDLRDKLQRSEIETSKAKALAERLRAGRADALDELQSVEAQFEQAMRMVTDLRTRVTVLSEEHDALRGRAKVSEEQLRQIETERQSLLDELDESRAALDEIRRSLVDAVVVSEHRWAEGKLD